ncbi:MAG: DNA adenine methylase [Planctomycetes bacterium]|nr:DNA adenine methylase [Planctomycetota bacterium]
MHGRPITVPSSDAALRFKAKIPHPIPYQGSKRRLAPRILSFFPAHVDRLVEPFAGSAAVSLAVAYHGMADRFVVNDAHEPIADLWREIILRPEELSENYATLWQDQLGRRRQYYDAVRARFNETRSPDLLLYLLARCVKGAVRYNAKGQFNNSPDNRRNGATPRAMRRRIAGASSLLSGRTRVDSSDYTTVVDRCGPSDLIYMDPPYQGVGGVKDSRYAAKFDHGQFRDVLAGLNHRGCMFAVSYDGRTGSKTFGEPLPERLRLIHLEIPAGRSSQDTLTGGDRCTYESLYLSPALAEAISLDRRTAIGYTLA